MPLARPSAQPAASITSDGPPVHILNTGKEPHTQPVVMHVKAYCWCLSIPFLGRQDNPGCLPVTSARLASGELFGVSSGFLSPLNASYSACIVQGLLSWTLDLFAPLHPSSSRQEDPEPRNSGPQGTKQVRCVIRSGNIVISWEEPQVSQGEENLLRSETAGKPLPHLSGITPVDTHHPPNSMANSVHTYPQLLKPVLPPSIRESSQSLYCLAQHIFANDDSEKSTVLSSAAETGKPEVEPHAC